ncbi:K02A2.6-like, partial [Cordylochernes scorpioides]
MDDAHVDAPDKLLRLPNCLTRQPLELFRTPVGHPELLPGEANPDRPLSGIQRSILRKILRHEACWTSRPGDILPGENRHGFTTGTPTRGDPRDADGGVAALRPAPGPRVTSLEPGRVVPTGTADPRAQRTNCTTPRGTTAHHVGPIPQHTPKNRCLGCIYSAVKLQGLEIWEKGLERKAIKEERSLADGLEWFADEILSNASIKKWDTVKLKLIQRFGYKVESPIVAASKRRLKREETVEDYFRDKIRLLNQTSLNNVEKLKMLTDGLPLDWKNYLVTAQAKDPSHWMQIAVEIEQNNNQIRQQQRSKTKVFNITTPTISKNCPYWCPICKKKGLYFKHWISDCKDYDPNYKDKLKHQATNITTDVKQTIADSLCIANTNFPYRFVNVEVLLNNIPVSSFIDTGSTISLMSCSLLKQHKLRLNVNDRIKIKQVDSFAYTLGSVEVFLKIHSKLVRCKLHVVKNFSYPLLIGLDVAGKFGLIIETKDKAVYVKGNECFYISPETHLPSVQQKELNQLLKENQALFSQHETDIGRIAVQHKIHTIEHPPISCRPYRRPLAEYDEIKRQVEELSKKGLIRESQSPWAFPVVLVSKKDGSQRMCIDYRKLNAITIDDKQPLPHIQDISTFKDHIELMNKIFDKLKENNIKLKLKKCSFAKQEIRYLGHIIGHNKIKPDPEKTKAINEFPQPKTVKQVRQFLGLAGYYRKFIPKFSEIADPLTSLTRKNKLFKWTTEVNKSFQELKSHLSTDPVLSTYDPSLPCKLYTDASKLGIGAILAQIGNDNQEHVISYYSRKLLPHQQNHSAFEMECFAVVQSVEYFEVYLENNTFEVITDHSALEWLFNVKKPKAKYLRWIIELSTKSMKIVHRSGSKQTHVDALSRSPVSLHISIPTLRLHQQKADLSFVKNSHIHRDLIMVKHNGVLKTVVPESFQEEILKEYHDNHSHPSINKTVRLITPFYWWPNAIKCIKYYVRSCKICQITKCSHKPFIGEYVAPNSDLKPLELISMDTIVLGSAANETKHKYIQVIIDHLTRFVWAFPTVTTSQAVIQCLDKINKTVPQIKCILTDNGKNFTSKEFNKFLNDHQVQHTYSTPYHPQSNGLCEKMNDTILTKLRTNLQENPRLKWSSLLAKIVKDYNSTPHDVTGFSPNFLLFGDCSIPEFSESPHFTIENARKKAIENSAKHREKWKARHDAKHPQSSFKVGDLVLRKIPSNDPTFKKSVRLFMFNRSLCGDGSGDPCTGIRQTSCPCRNGLYCS